MDIQERKDILQEAMEQLNAAIGNIETALRGTSHESHSQAYLVGHLRSWVDAEGTYNMGIQQYIDRLDEDGEELDEEIIEMIDSAITAKDARDVLNWWHSSGKISSEEHRIGKDYIKENFND